MLSIPNYKCLIILFSACIISIHAASQQQELDSLLNVLKHYKKEDTIKINLLNNIAYDYYSINADSGLLMAQQAIALAQKLNDPLKLATALSREALNYSGKGEDTTALKIYRQAFNIYKQKNYTKGMAAIYHNMGMIYDDMAEYPTAISYHQKAYTILNSLGNKQAMANALNSIGVNYMFLSDYPKALEYYFNSLRISEQLQDELTIANTSTNIGTIYMHLADYSKALQYLQQALNIYKKRGNTQGVADTYGNFGNVYSNTGDTANSFASYKKQLSISNNISYTRGIANASINMGIEYNDLKQYDAALFYVKKAIDAFQKNGNSSSLAAAFNELGKIYCNAPDDFLSKQNMQPAQRFANAVQYQLKSIKLAREAADINTEKTAWEDLGVTYKKQKNFEKALEAFNAAAILKDSILNTDKKSAITRLEMQNEFDKKETLIKTENDKKATIATAAVKQQQTIRNAVIAGAAILLAAAIFVFIFYKRKRDAVEKIKEAELRSETIETEMKALRAQMNPHFIFNSLNSIGDYILSNDIKSANIYLTKFANVMRLILENSEHTAVPLEDDLKALQLYMDIERLRLNNKFSYEIIVDHTIDKNNILIPPLILQPFVENSIWHGLTKKDGEGKIKINISRDNEMLVCVIEDNGIGSERSKTFKEEVKEMGKKSLGMKITNARIAVINKLKNANGSIEISNKEEGVRAEIRLPVQLNF